MQREAAALFAENRKTVGILVPADDRNSAGAAMRDSAASCWCILHGRCSALKSLYRLIPGRFFRMESCWRLWNAKASRWWISCFTIGGRN